MICLSSSTCTTSAFAVFPASVVNAWPTGAGGSAGKRRASFGAVQVPPGLLKPRSVTGQVRRIWKPVSCSDRPDNAQHGKKGDDRRAMLHKFVQEVQPQIMEQFTQQAPALVVNAMKQTITNMLGTLPPQFFGVTISTVGENLTQLMFSMMMTGYMFRNAQYRLEMCNALSLLPSPSTVPTVPPPALLSPPAAAPALPAPSTPPAATSLSSSGYMYVPGLPINIAGSNGVNSRTLPPTRGFLGDEDYAPGVQKTRVSGEVLRWHHSKGVESRPAVEYIDMLEAEVAMLKSQLARQNATQEDRNDLLEYMKTLEPVNLQELTASAEKDAVDAMHSFIQRLMGTADKEELRSTTSEITATELAKLLFWLMVVGYSLRSTEVRFEMEKALDTVSSRELPPGRL